MTTLADILHEHLTHRRSRGLSTETVDKDARMLKRFLRWLASTHGVTTADRLRKAHLHAYQKHLAAYHTAKGLPLKPGTINNRVKAVRNFLTFLHRRGYISEEHTDAIEYVKEPRMLPTSVLEHREVRKLLRRMDTTTALGYRNRTMLELLYSTGIRRGELLGLTVRDVHAENATMRVMGKGRKERMTPIGKTAMRFLETYLKAIRPTFPHAHETQTLFLSNHGRPLEASGLRAIINRSFGGASVRVTPHTFRRSCTTELVRANANLYHVKELLGHASLATLRPYTKLTIVDLKKTHAKCHPRERDEKRERG